MPINTRSMRSRTVQQSPAKETTAKATSSAVKPNARTMSAIKPPIGPPRSKKKRTDEPVPPLPPVPSSSRQIKEARVIKIAPKEKPVNLRAEFVDLSEFFNAAFSETKKIFKIFKDTSEELDKGYQLGLEVLKEHKKPGTSQLPLSYTPAGKKLYASLHATSALKHKTNVLNGEGKSKNEPSKKIIKLAENFDEDDESSNAEETAKISDVTVDTTNKTSNPNKHAPNPNKRLRSPEDAGAVNRAIDKVPVSFEFGTQSPGRKKLIIEDVASPHEEEIFPVMVANATYVQNKGQEINSSSRDESAELFSDEEMQAGVCEIGEAVKEPTPAKFVPEAQEKERVDSASSSSSSVSALVERFELKKTTKIIAINVKHATPTIVASKAQEVVFGGTPKSNAADKEPTIQPQLGNATFVFEDSVVESPIPEPKATSSILNQLGKQNGVLNNCNETFTKIVAYKKAPVDQTFLVNTNKLQVVSAEDSSTDDEMMPPSVSNKTYVKETKKIVVEKKLDPPAIQECIVPPAKTAASNKSKSNNSNKSGTSLSSSSSGSSMKSAVSQPSLTTKIKNTVLTGSAGSVFEKQKRSTKDIESDIKKRLMEREEEAVKRKLELDQRKMELQKKKNEEWKRKAEKMKADEKKVLPMPATAKFATTGYGSQFAVKGPTVNQNPIISSSKGGKTQNLVKAPVNILTSKFNPKNIVPPGDPTPRTYDEAGRFDDSYRTANDGCSFLDVTDMDPANNYDITRYEDIDEDCKHRENKTIPKWSRGENTILALFKQIPFENLDLPFFPSVDSKYKLFPNIGK